MISRDWRCLNAKCGDIFHSFDQANPPCPTCGCMRVDWVPGGGHIGGMSRRVDGVLRDIADQHGLTNLNSPSPSRLNRAMPAMPQPSISPELGHIHFGNGLSAPVSRDGPICVQSATGIRGSVTVGVPRTNRSKSIPGPSAISTTEYRHRPSRGQT
jgi:hypothetical protein